MPRMDRSGCRLSALRLKVEEVGLSKGNRGATSSKWSDLRENAVIHERRKRVSVAPHDSQSIRTAIWHGAVFPVACRELTQPNACQQLYCVSAEAHFPSHQLLRLQPAKKAHVGVLSPP